jgi:hypothetical protein
LKFLIPENALLLEHRFWLQVLGDHSRFILNALSPEEKEKIETAKGFIVLFDDLLNEARKNLSSQSIIELTEKSLEAAQNIRSFKLQIIKELITGNIKIELPPTFINHMVNEVEEYLRVLSFITQEQIYSVNPIYHHLLWLPDAAGHAGAINDNLDKIEKSLKEISNRFAETFDSMHIRAAELYGYMRTGVMDFPALNKLNMDVEKEMTLFNGFLKELEALIRSKEVLGTIAPLLIDHMYREECYYLTKLSQVSDVTQPKCDPAKERNE